MKRFIATSIAFLLLMCAVGFISNLLSREHVEAYVRQQNQQELKQVNRLWHLPAKAPNRVEEGSVFIRIDRTADGKPIKFALPPSAPLPFAYAFPEQIAPFLFRVHYGWAAGGKNMAFGEGGEKVVLSFFGHSKELREKPSWYF